MKINMEIIELMSFAAEIGSGLLESGAETKRVEDTLDRIIKHFYDGYSEILVVLTGFFVNIGFYTQTVRINRRSINLDKVSKINMLSRDIVNDKIDFEGAVERLKDIMAQKPYPLWIKTISAAMCCGFFTLLFGGNVYDALNSVIVGALLHVIINALRLHKTADFIVTFAGGVLLSVFTVLLYLIGLGENINIMINGAIMPLVPGLAITNALRDIIEGDYISGGARMFDAVVVAVALAAGAGSVMYMMGYMTGGIIW